MKPKIRYFSKTYLFGVQCGPEYVCSSKEAIGVGASASDAYKAWKADMPKTSIGRFLRRRFNAMFDRVFGC